MKPSETPRTDEMRDRVNADLAGYEEVLNHSRQLEQELNEAKDRAYLAESYLAEAEQGCDVYAERDQLRKVADAFEEYVKKVREAYQFEQDMTYSSTNTTEIFEADSVIDAYNQLPHIKQRNEK